MKINNLKRVCKKLYFKNKIHIFVGIFITLLSYYIIISGVHTVTKNSEKYIYNTSIRVDSFIKQDSLLWNSIK